MIGKDSPLFSRATDEWSTPQWLFDRLDQEFHFALDAAASLTNHKCNGYCDALGDGLKINWYYHSCGGAVYLNPPYSKIAAFMQKAYEESLKGATVVCLIPVRSDTRYWHDYVMKAHEIRFIKGRLKFGDAKSGAPFPSCIVIFRPDKDLIDTLANLGGPANIRSMEQPKKGSVPA